MMGLVRQAMLCYHDSAFSMSFTRSVAHNTILQTAGKVVSTILGLFTFALLARYLGQEGFGQYTTVFAYLGFFSVIADFGLYIIVVRELGRKEKSEEEILGNLLGLRLALAATILFIGVIAVFAFPYPGIVKTSVIIGAANFLFVAVIQLLVSLFQAHLQTFWVVLGEIAGRLVVIGLVLLLIAESSALSLIVAGVAIGSLANLLIILAASRRFVRLSLRYDRAYWRYIIRETLPIALSVILNLLYFRLGIIFLSLFRSEAEVGLYGAAYKVLEILVTFPNMFIGLILPALSYWVLNDPERFRRIFQRAFDLLIAGALPLLVGGVWLAKPLMIFISGEAFADSARVFQWLLFGVFALFLGSLSGHSIVAIGKQRVMVWGYLVVAATGITTYLLLIPRYGMFGAATGTILTEMLIMIIGYVIILRTQRFRLSLTGFVRTAFATAAMAGALWLLNGYGLFLNLIAAFLVYTGVLIAVGGVRKNEITTILQRRKESIP